MRTRLAIWGALALLGSMACAAEPSFKLKNGDHVLFYGDSITEQHLYTNDVETFVATRFPDLSVHFRNTGVGGDRVGGGWAGGIDVRLARDLIPYRPTVLTIMLGMNDAQYRQFDPGIFNTYRDGYTKIVAQVRKALPGCKLWLIQPSPFDDFAHKPNWDGGYNGVLVRYGQFVKGLAANNGFAAIDLNGPVVQALTKAAGLDPTLAADLIKDRVHPGAEAQLLMAAEILKAWGASATVTDVAIDFGSRKVLRSSSSQVALGDGLQWTQLDARLPYPLKPAEPLTALALRSSDFVETLDRQMLAVSGLPGSSYSLKIDGRTVGAFAATELAKGINLALLPTPMVDQAFRVKELVDKHNSIFMARWRNVQLSLGDQPGFEKAAAGLEAFEEEVVKALRSAAKPIARRYELVRQ